MEMELEKKPAIAKFLPEELEAYLEKECAVQKFRAAQILSGLYRQNAVNFKDARGLGAELSEKLSAKLDFTCLTEIERHVSKLDGSAKMLFQLRDGGVIETAIIRVKDRATVCISSQLGCPLGCRFCASTQAGFRRNLNPGEMVEQVVHAGRMIGQRIDHIVFMGIGEPLLNCDNVFKAINIINHPKCLDIGARKITVSSVGVLPGLKKFEKQNWQVELAISLHAPTSELRGELIPAEFKWPIAEVIEFLQGYYKRAKRLVTFEYALISGVNCAPEHAHQLAELLKDVPYKLNLILMNPVEKSKFKPALPGEVTRFRKELERLKIFFTIRAKHGHDIDAACGQLRADFDKTGDPDTPKSHSEKSAENKHPNHNHGKRQKPKEKGKKTT